MESVLEAAERAGAEIRRDAEEWAERHMEETRRRADDEAEQRMRELSTITDDLLTRARSMATEFDELIGKLDATARQPLRVPGGESDEENRRGRDLPGERRSEQPLDPRLPVPSAPQPTAEPPSAQPRESRPAEPETVTEPKATGNGGKVSEGARLLATQMAVAGSTREMIAARLREEFGIHEPSAILDDAGL